MAEKKLKGCQGCILTPYRVACVTIPVRVPTSLPQAAVYVGAHPIGRGEPNQVYHEPRHQEPQGQLYVEWYHQHADRLVGR